MSVSLNAVYNKEETLNSSRKISKLGNVLILRNALGGGGGLDFVTEPYTAKGICRVLRYEGGEGSKKTIFALRNKRTFPYKINLTFTISETMKIPKVIL
jgi:hypothetical protein